MNPFAQVSDFGIWLRSNGLEIVLWALGAIILGRVVHYTGQRVTTRIDAGFQHSDALVRTETAKHRHALAQVITWVIQIAVYILIGFQILELLGVRTAGLAIPASVLGAALGFGAQRIVQDILAGFFIITERQYGYGDVVRISVTGSAEIAEGAIEDVTLRITRMRSADGEVITVPNGQIVKVDNLSKDWARAVVDVPIAAGADISRVNQILHAVGAAAIEDRHLAPLLLDEPTVMGVESLEVDQVNMRLVARTLPGKQFEVGRILRERVVAALAREGLGVAAAEVNETTRAVEHSPEPILKTAGDQP
ncbi:MAG TPA: mechanosensitive ion channel family protein [Aldersonia sp.]